MGDAAGQLAERLHLLRLAQGILGITAPAHIQLGGEEIGQLACIVVHRRHEQRIPEGRAILAVVDDLHRDLALLLHCFANLGDHRAIGFGTLQETAVAAQQLVHLVAGHLGEGVVGEEDGIVRLVGIGDQHRHSRGFHRGEEDVLALVRNITRRGVVDPRLAGWGNLAHGAGPCTGRRGVKPSDSQAAQKLHRRRA